MPVDSFRLSALTKIKNDYPVFKIYSVSYITIPCISTLHTYMHTCEIVSMCVLAFCMCV